MYVNLLHLKQYFYNSIRFLSIPVLQHFA